MTFLKILSGGIAGTSLMTLFSYYLSYKTKKEFKEPVLLHKLLTRSRFGLSEKNKAAGWILHYLVGFTFVISYHIIWSKTTIQPSFLHSTVIGLASGFAGVAGWHILIMIHRNPPSIHLKDYYLHLLAAHIIFGWGAAAGYNLFSS